MGLSRAHSTAAATSPMGFRGRGIAVKVMFFFGISTVCDSERERERELTVISTNMIRHTFPKIVRTPYKSFLEQQPHASEKKDYTEG